MAALGGVPGFSRLCSSTSDAWSFADGSPALPPLSSFEDDVPLLPLLDDDQALAAEVDQFVDDFFPMDVDPLLVPPPSLSPPPSLQASPLPLAALQPNALAKPVRASTRKRRVPASSPPASPATRPVRSSQPKLRKRTRAAGLAEERAVRENLDDENGAVSVAVPKIVLPAGQYKPKKPAKPVKPAAKKPLVPPPPPQPQAGAQPTLFDKVCQLPPGFLATPPPPGANPPALVEAVAAYLAELPKVDAVQAKANRASRLEAVRCMKAKPRKAVCHYPERRAYAQKRSRASGRFGSEEKTGSWVAANEV